MQSAVLLRRGVIDNTAQHDDDADDSSSTAAAAREVTSPTMLFRNLRISDWTASLKTLHENPLDVSVWIRGGGRSGSSFSNQSEQWMMLPLHAAIIYGAPSYVTLEILRAYPNAARKKDLKGRLPIHLAAASVVGQPLTNHGQRRRIIVINDLVRVFPESLWVVDDTGRTAMELVELLQMQIDEIDGKKKKKKLLESVNIIQKKSEEEQREDYKILYDLLSQGIAPVGSHEIEKNPEMSDKKVITNNVCGDVCSTEGSHFTSIPHAVSSESNSSIKRTITKIFSRRECKKRDFVLSSDQDDKVVRCDDVVCSDGIIKSLPGLTANEEETEKIALHSFPQRDEIRSIINNAVVATDKIEETRKTNMRILANLDVFKSRNKRRKTGPLGGSKSFESIATSNSEEEERHHVTRQPCDCESCTTAAEITKEMSEMRKSLISFDHKKRSTLLFDYLITSDWGNAMTRISNRPSEVQAWAMTESSDGEVVLDLLPLHAAIVLGAPLNLIVALIDAFPTGAGEVDANQSFPIHLAAACFTNIGGGDRVVDHLLKAFRCGKQAVDANGRTPRDIISIMSTAHEHKRAHTTRTEEKAKILKITKTFEDDAAFAYLVEKAMQNLGMSLQYQHTFLRQASSHGIETIDDLVMADNNVFESLFSEKALTAELRRLLSFFIEDHYNTTT